MNEDGMDVEYVVPEEGTVAYTNYFVMARESEERTNREEVYALLN